MIRILGIPSEREFNLEIESGAFFTDVSIGSIKTRDMLSDFLQEARVNGKCLGASLGGSFKIEPINTPKGINWDASISTLLKTIPETKIEKVLPMLEIKKSEKVTEIKIKSSPTIECYIEKLLWVAISTDGSFMCVELDNAINTSGIDFGALKGENKDIPVTFRARTQNTNQIPCRIYKFD